MSIPLSPVTFAYAVIDLTGTLKLEHLITVKTEFYVVLEIANSGNSRLSNSFIISPSDALGDNFSVNASRFRHFFVTYENYNNHTPVSKIAARGIPGSKITASFIQYLPFQS